MILGKRLLAALLLSAVVTGCGDPIGAACLFSGSGFTASDNCRHRCMQFRDIVCPDGTALRPKICSGKPLCEPGDCPSGQVCYHVNDPFEKESYCLPADICGPQSAASLARWEKASLVTSEATLAAREEKNKLRSKGQSPTFKTAPIDNAPRGE